MSCNCKDCKRQEAIVLKLTAELDARRELMIEMEERHNREMDRMERRVEVAEAGNQKRDEIINELTNMIPSLSFEHG